MTIIDLKHPHAKLDLQVATVFPHLAMGIVHIENTIICAGGWRQKHLRNVLRINHTSHLDKLTPMPNPKAKFPLIHWKSAKCVLTVGGYCDFNLREVTCFDLVSQKWKQLPSQEFPFASRAGCVVQPHTVYTFGGWRRQMGRSIEWLSLNKQELRWKILNTVMLFIPRNRDSAVSVRNSIVVFGSWNGKATVELSASKQEKLEVTRNLDDCINYSTSSYATYKLYKTELYAFERDRTEEVFQYGREQGWTKIIEN